VSLLYVGSLRAYPLPAYVEAASLIAFFIAMAIAFISAEGIIYIRNSVKNKRLI